MIRTPHTCEGSPYDLFVALKPPKFDHGLIQLAPKLQAASDRNPAGLQFQGDVPLEVETLRDAMGQALQKAVLDLSTPKGRKALLSTLPAGTSWPQSSYNGPV